VNRILENRQDVEWPFDLLDFLEGVIRDAEEKRTFAATLAGRFTVQADAARHAALAGDERAQQWLGRLTVLNDRLASIPVTASTRLLTLEEAAQRLNLVRPNGKPRDSAYAVIERAGGRKIAGKWTIAETDLTAYMKGGRR
jgi:hypothetical protein